MLRPKILGLAVLVITFGLPLVANAAGLIRPTTMGVEGGNDIFNTKGNGVCFDQKGTLGALVTDGTSL
jgi:hypothetical protein